jgi:hypothetical protein
MSRITPPTDGQDLSILVLEDVVSDGYGLVRTEASPAALVAVAHDGTPRGVEQAQAHAALLARAPAMRRLLDQALGFEVDAFDADEPVSGADLVGWFAVWRLEVRAALSWPASHTSPDDPPA